MFSVLIFSLVVVALVFSLAIVVLVSSLVIHRYRSFKKYLGRLYNANVLDHKDYGD